MSSPLEDPPKITWAVTDTGGEFLFVLVVVVVVVSEHLLFFGFFFGFFLFSFVFSCRGYLANKAIWHNKGKMRSYGELFRQGDTIGVHIDMDIGTLSFSRNGKDLGTAIAAVVVIVGGGD